MTSNTRLENAESSTFDTVPSHDMEWSDIFEYKGLSTDLSTSTKHTTADSEIYDAGLELYATDVQSCSQNTKCEKVKSRGVPRIISVEIIKQADVHEGQASQQLEKSCTKAPPGDSDISLGLGSDMELIGNETSPYAQTSRDEELILTEALLDECSLSILENIKIKRIDEELLKSREILFCDNYGQQKVAYILSEVQNGLVDVDLMPVLSLSASNSNIEGKLK